MWTLSGHGKEETMVRPPHGGQEAGQRERCVPLHKSLEMVP